MNARQALESILHYGPFMQVNTPLGVRIVRRSLANQKFWFFYHKHADELRKQGITFRQNGSQWWVTEWTVPGGDPLIASRNYDPAIVGKLFKWQVAPATQLIDILDRRPFGGDFSDAGTGKTAVSCAVAALTKRPMVVMCAKYAKPEWERMAKHIGTELLAISHWELVRAGKTHLGKFDRIKVQLKTKEKEILSFVWNKEFRKSNALLVIDEIHNCGGIATQNSLMAIGARTSGLSMLGLSATAADTPLRMQVLAYLLGLIRDPGHFFGWALKHGVKKGKFGFTFGDPSDPHVHTMRREIMQDIHNQIFGKGLAVRVRKRDIPEFPKCQVFVEAIDCSGSAQRINAEYKAIAHALREYELQRMAAKEARRNIVHARQQIELLKLPTVVDMVKDDIAQGFQTVVFVNYRATAIAMGHALRVPIFIGGQQTEERLAAMKGFQGTKLMPPSQRAVVSTYGAGSESINLQDEFGWGERKGILFPTFRAQHIVQASNRIHRATSVTPCTQRFIYAHDTIEADTMDGLRNRIAQLDMMNDGMSLPMPSATFDAEDGS